MPRQTKLRPAGHIIIDDPDLPHPVQMDLLQCVHCQFMWVVQPGSGRRRGWCFKCGGPTCGADKCMECGAIERRTDLYEAGKIVDLMSPLDRAPVSVAPKLYFPPDIKRSDP